MEVKTKTPLEEYLSLPEGHPAELIGGEIVMSPSPSIKHQRVAKRIFTSLELHVEKMEKGEVFYETDVHFDDENVLRPDIVYVSDESRISENWIEGAPDIVIEILSPSSAIKDLVEKKDTYERFGVREYWVIDPESEEIIVFLNENGKFKIACRGKECESIVLKGFKWGFKG